MPNTRFDKRLQNLPPALWTKISQIDELKGGWASGTRLSPQVLNRLKYSCLVTSTGASTRIEGARLSDEEIEKMMRGIKIQKFADRDQQEVKGYFELLTNVFNAWETLRLNEGMIKHLHRELLKYVTKDEQHRGEYKKKENKVQMIGETGKSIATLFDTTPAYLTPKEIQELIEWTQNTFKANHHHPLLVIANFIVEFLKIHPFEDGNGRLSRVLTNLFLLQRGYAFVPYVSHESIIERNKPDYYMALRKSQKTFTQKRGNIVPWLEFFLDVLLRQAKSAMDLLSRENIEKLLSQKQLIVWQYLQMTPEAVPGEIARKTKIARPTINQALVKLLRLKQIERIGLGRGTRYRKV